LLYLTVTVDERSGVLSGGDLNLLTDGDRVTTVCVDKGSEVRELWVPLLPVLQR